MICQSDRTIRITSTAARAEHAYAVCPAEGIPRSATTTRHSLSHVPFQASRQNN
ncbi:hypothetical protein JG687_00018217 [Phytophthora cactorum]|uniref:Uncharacterized protein n=1 Tax=Phytophthora cactorum TaxID=29920 RepID=A0A8T1TQD7_9STRA|nr:hypothetical protein GQ600_5129 [Phytophthora cactorum]KAG6943821.1 hypothetical protein JG687_00018217 [Phytophthora cactorum]